MSTPSTPAKQPKKTPTPTTLLTKHIVQNGDPVLRDIAQPVPVTDILSEKIQRVIADMKQALATQKDGVAIAAPQIGVPLRIFVISGAVLASALNDTEKGKKLSAEFNGEDIVFINPEITKLSREKAEMEEGCLSVRWLYGKVKRATRATIRAYDERGRAFERGASGLFAQIFQHECDHLDGILFIDKATDVQDIPPEKQNQK